LKLLLMFRDGEPPDPACFVTAVPNWSSARGSWSPRQAVPHRRHQRPEA
jgi:hypothetical protein